MTLFAGITQRVIHTPGLDVGILERVGDDADASAHKTVVFVHGEVSSSEFWMSSMLDLPSDLRVIAIDLRGFGATEHAPVDATRGLRDFSDDLHATLDTLAVRAPHVVGWSMGGGVIMQYALDHHVRSLTLQAPVSPYGFGGTRRDGSRLTGDDAGTGAGAASPDFVQRLTDADTSDDAATSPRSMLRTMYFAPDAAVTHEDVYVASMITTSTATGNYPGDIASSPQWPGFAAGKLGVLNAMAPGYFNTAALIDLDDKPPILWVHGSADAVISDASLSDVNHLGQLGVIPDWPGEEVAPAQPMVSQTRDVLAAYAEAGGMVTEALLEGVGHAPHLENPEDFRAALLAHIGPAHFGLADIGTDAPHPGFDPSPPTEAFIIPSED